VQSKPLIVGALGSRGSGKSAWVRQYLARVKPARLAVFDLMQEHADLGAPTADLGAAIRAMKARRFAVVFQPSRDDKARAAQFDLWCRACMAVGDLWAYVEELAFVTTAHKAPPGWREMCLLGRHARHRVSIIATSQRPSQVDKEFLANVDLLHCGRLAHRGDAEAAADVLAVSAQELQTLPDLAWIERGAGDVACRRGVLSFGPAKPARGRPKGAQPKAGNSTAADAGGTVAARRPEQTGATVQPNPKEPAP
jgi:hypothetical protein